MSRLRSYYPPLCRFCDILWFCNRWLTLKRVEAECARTRPLYGGETLGRGLQARPSGSCEGLNVQRKWVRAPRPGVSIHHGYAPVTLLAFSDRVRGLYPGGCRVKYIGYIRRTVPLEARAVMCGFYG
jgi:hypothetical protein